MRSHSCMYVNHKKSPDIVVIDTKNKFINNCTPLAATILVN